MINYGKISNYDKINFIDQYKSPNFGDRVSIVVIHHTGSPTLQSAIDIFTKRDSVSVHFLVGKDGSVYRLVDEIERAFHAGISAWGNRTSINDTSVGIEIDNNGVEPFTDEQHNTVAMLCGYLVKKYNIEPRNIVGHADIAPHRKQDPNAYFNWKIIYDYLGVFPGLYESSMSHDEMLKIKIDSGSTKNEIEDLQSSLRLYGYPINVTGVYDADTKYVVTAFNRHFTYDVAFIKEQEEDDRIILNPKNENWYNISDERLQKLVNYPEY